MEINKNYFLKGFDLSGAQFSGNFLIVGIQDNLFSNDLESKLFYIRTKEAPIWEYLTKIKYVMIG